MTARNLTKTAVAPRVLGETIDAYLEQISVSLRPSTVASAAGILKRFERFMADFDPAVVSATDLRRRHVEGYKSWLAAQPARRRPRGARRRRRRRRCVNA